MSEVTQQVSDTAIESFWAELRSTNYLFQKSVLPSERQRARLRAELWHILGKRIIAYPQVLREFGIGPKTPYKYKKIFLGVDKTCNASDIEPNELKFMKFMVDKAAQSQKANWCWRITQEAEQRQEEGWYPFFVTLTVDPKRTDPEKLWREGREFRKYIRRLANVVAEQLGHPPPHKTPCKYHGVDWPSKSESEYIKYAGVIEHGKTQEHHHAHIMVWMREIPSLWKIDPNAGKLKQYSTERECRHMRRFWPWSIPSQCPALYFRTKGDVWSRLGHTTPIDEKTQKPIKINSVEAVGNYVTKYMQKGNKVWNHRMKCTRNLGMNKIQELVKSMETETLEALSWRPADSSQLRSVSLIHSVPQGLTRSLAKRTIFARQWALKQLDLKKLMKTNYEHYTRMLRSVRSGARPDRMPSAEFYDWVQEFQPEIKGYCEKRLIAAHEKLRYDFPRKVHRIQPIVIGANNSGFTQCI